MSLDQADLLRIIDYLDDRLSPSDMMEFEVRLADEPELADSFSSFEEMDRLQRSVLARQARDDVAGSSPRWGLWSAAAALLLLALGLFQGSLGKWFEDQPGRSRPNIDFAILPSGPEPGDFHRELGVEVASGPEFPDSWESVRGAGGEGRSDREYYDWVAPFQEQRLASALSTPDSNAPLDYFTIALRTDRELSAVVLMIDSDGTIRGEKGESSAVAYPAPGAWSVETGRLTPGRIEALPRRGAIWSEADDGLAEFEPGFLVPIGVLHVDVLVGLREEPLDEALHSDLVKLVDLLATESGTGDRTRTSIEAWLAERGFEVRAQRVFSKP